MTGWAGRSRFHWCSRRGSLVSEFPAVRSRARSGPARPVRCRGRGLRDRRGSRRRTGRRLPTAVPGRPGRCRGAAGSCGEPGEAAAGGDQPQVQVLDGLAVADRHACPVMVRGIGESLAERRLGPPDRWRRGGGRRRWRAGRQRPKWAAAPRMGTNPHTCAELLAIWPGCWRGRTRSSGSGRCRAGAAVRPGGPRRRAAATTPGRGPTPRRWMMIRS